MEPTVLDCDYNLKDTDAFLTVKWFRNDNAIYQWIRGSQPAPIVSINVILYPTDNNIVYNLPSLNLKMMWTALMRVQRTQINSIVHWPLLIHQSVLLETISVLYKRNQKRSPFTKMYKLLMLEIVH